MLLLALLPSALALPEIDPARLDETVRILSGADALDGAPFVSRHISHPDHDRAGAWLRARLEEVEGLQVREEVFEGGGMPANRNLVADLPGEDPALGWLIVGAHWDSTASYETTWNPVTDAAPGADDDASGVAAVLEIARRMAAGRWEHPVRFALFDAEEEGLLGSAVHAAGLREADETVGMMWAMDPIGYNHNGGGFLWVTWDPRWQDFGDQLAALGADWSPTLTTTSLDRNLIGGATRSDHASFWDQGYPALHIAGWPQPVTYHTLGDTVDGVDPAFHLAVTELVSAHVEGLAIPVEGARGGAPKGCGCAHAGSAGAWSGVALLVAVRRRRKRNGPTPR